MKILFICLGNVARSQMAEAYYNYFAESNNASSAGVLDFTPAKYGHPIKEVTSVMKENGIDVSHKKVKFITEEMVQKSDKIFVMCKEKECPKFLLDSNKVTFWEISDPFGTTIDNFRIIRDIIKSKVSSILASSGNS